MSKWRNEHLGDFDLFAYFISKGMTPKESVVEMLEHNQDMFFTRLYLQGLIDLIDKDQKLKAIERVKKRSDDEINE
jgi:hypothetical protein